jgi:hypothetical protein
MCSMPTIWPSWEPGVERETGWALPFSFAGFAIRVACWTRWSRRPRRCWPSSRDRSASIRRCSANTPAGPKPVASTCSNFKGCCVSGASVSPTGGPVFGWARTRRGPRIAANPSSGRCSPICERIASCFRRQRCWSESDWPLVRERERRPSRRLRLGCPMRSAIRSRGCSRSIPSCAAPASPGCGIIRNRPRHPTSSRYWTVSNMHAGWGSTRRGLDEFMPPALPG